MTFLLVLWHLARLVGNLAVLVMLVLLLTGHLELRRTAKRLWRRRELELREADVDISHFRDPTNGNPGVRVTHLRTGRAAACAETKSQHTNEQLAIEAQGRILNV